MPTYPGANLFDGPQIGVGRNSSSDFTNQATIPTGSRTAAFEEILVVGLYTNALPVPVLVASFPGTHITGFYEDYYNRIWFVPTSVDLGAVSSEVVADVVVWNAYRNPVTLTSINAVGNIGVTLGDIAPPETIGQLRILPFKVIAYEDGPPSIDATFTFNFSGLDSYPLPVTGSRARLWPFVPNWDDAFEVTYEFRTEIITSRTKREQRRALRQTPRKALSFSTAVDGERFRTFIRDMSAWQQRPFIMPEFSRHVATAVEMLTGSNSVTVGAVPPWVVAGGLVTIMNKRDLGMFTVASIDGNEITFVNQATVTWPVGSKIMPGLTGRLNDNIRAAQLTSRAIEINVDFSADPGLEPVIPTPPAPSAFNGYELFHNPINWAERPSPSFTSFLETVDFGFGRESHFIPAPFNIRFGEASYLGASLEQVDELLELFSRMKGRRGEFYAPTGTADIELKEDIRLGTNNVRIEGQQFAIDYGENTVYRAIYLKLVDGTTIQRLVEDIYPVDDVNGQDSVIQLTDTWPQDITLDQIAFVSWLPRWRFASDSLVVQWLTDEVATLIFTAQTVEHLDGN